MAIRSVVPYLGGCISFRATVLHRSILVALIIFGVYEACRGSYLALVLLAVLEESEYEVFEVIDPALSRL